MEIPIKWLQYQGIWWNPIIYTLNKAWKFINTSQWLENSIWLQKHKMKSHHMHPQHPTITLDRILGKNICNKYFFYIYSSRKVKKKHRNNSVDVPLHTLLHKATSNKIRNLDLPSESSKILWNIEGETSVNNLKDTLDVYFREIHHLRLSGRWQNIMCTYPTIFTTKNVTINLPGKAL